MKKILKKSLKLRVLFLVPFLIYLLFCLLLFDIKVDTGGDNVVYMILAKSIADHKSYSNLHIVSSPPHNRFPPFFPLLLVPFYKVFGLNESFLKILPFISSIFSFIFLIFIIKDFWIVLVFSVTPILISYSSKLLSESTFLFFSLLAIYFVLRGNYFISSIFSTITFFIRNSGIALVFGLFTLLLIRKKFKDFLISATIFFIPTFLWFLRTRATLKSPEDTYYFDFIYKNPYNPEIGIIGFVDLLARIVQNIKIYVFQILPYNFLPFEDKSFLTLFGIIIIFFVSFSFFRRIKRISIVELYFLFFLLILFIWPPVWASDRFLMPILPFFLVYFFEGIKLTFKEKISKLVVLIIFLINSFYLISRIPENLKEWRIYKKNKIEVYPPDWQRFFEVCYYIKENIPKDKKIISRKPPFVYLISGNQGNLYPFSEDPDSVYNFIKNYDYVILDNFLWSATTRRYLLPAIKKYLNNFEIVYYTKNEPFTYLLKIKK